MAERPPPPDVAGGARKRRPDGGQGRRCTHSQAGTAGAEFEFGEASCDFYDTGTLFPGHHQGEPGQ